MIFYLIQNGLEKPWPFILMHFKSRCNIAFLEELLVKNLTGARGEGCGHLHKCTASKVTTSQTRGQQVIHAGRVHVQAHEVTCGWL